VYVDGEVELATSQLADEVDGQAPDGQQFPAAQ
jgi:hypothetical protein